MKNEFFHNHKILYIIVAIAAFIAGNYLFDLLAKIF